MDDKLIDRRPARSDLGPTTREYVKSMGWRSVNFHTHISLVHKYVYVEVPKAGCGTMKATLGALEGARLNETHAQRFLDKPHNGLKSGAHVRPYHSTVRSHAIKTQSTQSLRPSRYTSTSGS